MNELALFAGAGGGVLGTHLLGWHPICAVEKEPFRREVLLRRQRDGVLPMFPIWDDIRTFDGRPWRGLVDVITGGFPCQDISCAGKGAGISGDRSGLWNEMERIIGEVRPRYVLVENSPTLIIRGLGRLLADLSRLGFDAEWGNFSACSVGAPHTRKRLFLLAYSDSERCAWRGPKLLQRRPPTLPRKSSWWDAEPLLDRVANGISNGMDRIAAIGDSQVPAVVVLAWKKLSRRIGENL